MDQNLKTKLEELKNADDYECWYLVKQYTSFVSLCYQVKFLQDYQKNSNNKLNIQDYVRNSAKNLNKKNKDLNISEEYRALRVAVFFGLIKESDHYEDAKITDTFEEITSLCNGKYEKIDNYISVVQRQIEKIFISSRIDKQSNHSRKKFRLYPVMLLYKVLFEMGLATEKYKITMDEYKFFVATTKTNQDFLKTIELIEAYRSENSAQVEIEFKKYQKKFDNRFVQALKQLPTLEVEKNKIEIPKNKINEVADKINDFEKNYLPYNDSEYLEFLASTSSFSEIKKYHVDKRLEGGKNIILYGVPGVGKSYVINHDYAKENSSQIRIVFHQDYTYSDFVGQIMPVIDENTNGNRNIDYRFVPGPFTRILKKAYQNPGIKHFLIIEEINRGNAPAIFGDIFQLLDRKNFNDTADTLPIGTSEYKINNENIARYVFNDREHGIRIPSNLSIIATMNTSDQNVFTLDTAFQRRWSMRLIENKFHEKDKELAEKEILDTGVTWKQFCTVINNIILSKNEKLSSSEDKRLGVHFVSLEELEFDSKVKSVFAEKVIKYLWDDAFKFSRSEVFDISNYNCLEDIIQCFNESKKEHRFDIFFVNIRAELGIA